MHLKEQPAHKRSIRVFNLFDYPLDYPAVIDPEIQDPDSTEKKSVTFFFEEILVPNLWFVHFGN